MLPHHLLAWSPGNTQDLLTRCYIYVCVYTSNNKLNNNNNNNTSSNTSTSTSTNTYTNTNTSTNHYTTSGPGNTQDLLKRCLISPSSQSNDCFVRFSFFVVVTFQTYLQRFLVVVLNILLVGYILHLRCLVVCFAYGVFLCVCYVCFGIILDYDVL